MTIEDDFITELNDYEHRIIEITQEKEEALRQQAEERSLKEEAIRKQEEERAQKLKAVSLLLSLGMPKTEIAQQLGLSLDALDELEA